MANIKSSQKRAVTNEIRRKRNVARKSEIKTVSRKVLDAIAGNEIEQAKEFLRVAKSKIARAGSKGVFKKNTASRKIGRLARRVAAAEKGIPVSA